MIAFRRWEPRLRLFVPLSTIEFDGMPFGPCAGTAIGEAFPTMTALRFVLYHASASTVTVWKAPVYRSVAPSPPPTSLQPWFSGSVTGPAPPRRTDGPFV